MKIIVRHPDGDSGDRLAMHAEKLLQRVLDSFCPSIDTVEVKMKAVTSGDGRPRYRCILKAMPISGSSILASASDQEAILAMYRAAERMKFQMNLRSKSETGTAMKKQ